MKKALILLLMTSSAFAQQSFKLGLEGGYTYGGKGSSESLLNLRQDQITRTRSNKGSWLVGIKSEMTLRRFFYFSAALQYQEKGSSFTDDRVCPGTTNGMAYTYHYSQSIRFKKICMPLAAGLTIQIGRIKPAIFAGWRPNLVFNGQHRSVTSADYQDPATQDQYTEYNYKPWLGNKTGMAMRVQRFYGISVGFNQLTFSFTVNKGGTIVYTDSPLGCIGYSCPNNDYLFTVSYFCQRNSACLCKIKSKTVRFL